MRILIAAKHPPGGRLPIGGVQSWSATVAQELRRQGHDVTIWGPEWPAPAGRFDAGIFANVSHTGPAMARCAGVLTIAHGIVPDERPRGDLVAYTSEEVRAHWGGTGPILRQPIDLEFWSPAGARRPELLFYGYRATHFAVALAAARRLGMAYRHLRTATHEEARCRMRDAACVLASGRAALEAMACAAPVVVCDHRASYQAPLMDTDLQRQMQHNYSGRGGVAPEVDRLVEAISSSAPNRAHVERYHDARQVVQEILCLLS